MLLRSSSSPLLSSLLSAAAENHVGFPSTARLPRLRASVRRTHSEGNLEALAPPPPPPACPERISASLESFPSDTAKDPGDSEDGEESAPYDDPIAPICGGDGSLFLARGIGIDGESDLLGFPVVSGDGGYPSGGGGRGGGGYAVVTDYGGEKSDLEGFLRKMVEEHPSDALFLRNYAQFLYRSKKDVRKADEYYSRAILAEPGDGEVLSEYGKLVWENYGDRERAMQYLERAVQASPEDSQVLAGYAHFLWAGAEEEEGDEGEDLPLYRDGPTFSRGAMASAVI